MTTAAHARSSSCEQLGNNSLSEQIAERLRLLSALLNNTTVGVAFFDRRLRCTALNGAFARMIGTSADGQAGYVPPCTAVALALTAPAANPGGLQLHVSQPTTPGAAVAAGWPVLTLDALAAALAGGAPRGAWRLGCGGWVELKPAPAENCL